MAKTLKIETYPFNGNPDKQIVVIRLPALSDDRQLALYADMLCAVLQRYAVAVVLPHDVQLDFGVKDKPADDDDVTEDSDDEDYAGSDK